MRPKLRELQGKTKNSSLTSNIPTKIRNLDKYKDQSKLSLIDDVHVMTYAEAAKLPNGLRPTGGGVKIWELFWQRKKIKK